MRFTKALLKKPYDELTDEELKAIGRHFLKHPLKPPRKLHKCITCKRLVWYDNLGETLWQCLENPCDDIKTQSDRLLNNRQVTHARYCDNWYDENKPWPEDILK